MSSADAPNRSGMESVPAHFPALGRLRLLDREWDALCCQGFVSGEQRGEKVIYKLRFRLDAKQYVRYIASDQERARAVQAELDVLQRHVQLRRDLAKQGRIAALKLKDAKLKLQPWLEVRGFHFHGLAFRKRRKTKLTDVLI